MKVLAIDCSAKAASVAVMEEGSLLCEGFVNTKITHSQTLMPMMKAMLDSAKISLDDIDLLAVSKGPGSFTGVRIGIAAVKGIAHAKELPCVGVSTLLSMAMNIDESDRVLCCAMDARCSQVYNALFEAKGGEITRLCQDRVLTVSELAQELAAKKAPVLLLGDGARICYDSFKCAGIDLKLAPENLLYQRAYGVAKAALDDYKKGIYCSARELAPLYLRRPQAERELNSRCGKQ